MSTLCTSPISFETFVAYWAGDLSPGENDALEGHVMGCASCTATSARVAAVTESIRAQIPPVVSREALAKLRARGVRIVDNPVKPGERKKAIFAPGVEVLIHRLGGLALSHATEVDVTVKVEETGDILMHAPAVPFDAETGEVLIACQRHFSAYPPNIVFEVRTRDALHKETLAVYSVPHEFG